MSASTPPPGIVFSAAAARNHPFIWQELQPLLGPTGHALEVASGSGQHAALFAAAQPGWRWQPSDLRDTHFADIAAWGRHTGAAQLAPAVLLDVRDALWPSAQAPFLHAFDLVYCTNLLHISPPECGPALLQGAARHLRPGGLLSIYGPFLEEGVPTAPSNLAFDADLRQRNPAWGLRQLATLQTQATQAGLQCLARHSLPANNLLLVFQRPAA